MSTHTTTTASSSTARVNCNCQSYEATSNCTREIDLKILRHPNSIVDCAKRIFPTPYDDSLPSGAKRTFEIRRVSKESAPDPQKYDGGTILLHRKSVVEIWESKGRKIRVREVITGEWSASLGFSHKSVDAIAEAARARPRRKQFREPIYARDLPEFRIKCSMCGRTRA